MFHYFRGIGIKKSNINNYSCIDIGLYRNVFNEEEIYGEIAKIIALIEVTTLVALAS